MARRNDVAIKNEIDNHQFALAEADLRQVLVEKPQSAKAHYWLGQVLSYEDRTSDALAEIEKARSIDPQLGFTTADHFQRTEAQMRSSLAGHTAVTPPAPPPAQTSMSSALNKLDSAPTPPTTIPAPITPVSHPAASTTTSTPPQAQPHIVQPKPGLDNGSIFMIGVVLIVAYFIFRGFRNRQAMRLGGMPGAGMPGGAPGYGNNYPPPGYGPGGYGPGGYGPQGSGMGGVIPGVIGGVVLGEMLAHHSDAGATVIHDVVHDQPPAYTPAPDPSSNFDAGTDDGGSFGGGGDSGNFDSGGGGDF